MSNSYIQVRRGVALGVVVLIAAKIVSLHIEVQTISKVSQGQLQSSLAALFVSVVLASGLYGLLSGMTMVQVTPNADLSNDDIAVQYCWTLARVFYLSILTAAALYVIFSRLHLDSFPQSLLWYWTYGLFALSGYHLLYRLGGMLKNRRSLRLVCLVGLGLLNLSYFIYELYFGVENSSLLRIFSSSESIVFAVALDVASVAIMFSLRLFSNANGATSRSPLSCERLYGSNLRFPWSEGLLIPHEDIGSSPALSSLLRDVRKPLLTGVVLSLAASSNFVLRTFVTFVMIVATIGTGAVAFDTHQGVFYLIPVALSYLGAQVYLWSFRSFSQRENLLVRFVPDFGRLEREITLVLGLIYLVLFWAVEAILLLPVIGFYNYAVVGVLSIAISLGSIFAVATFIVTYSSAYLDIVWARGGRSRDAARSVLRQSLICLVASTGVVSLVQFHALGTATSFLLEATISVVAFSLILPLAASSWIGRREYGLQRTTSETKR